MGEPMLAGDADPLGLSTLLEPESRLRDLGDQRHGQVLED